MGPIIAAPISENYGRSIVYKVTSPLHILFTLGAGCSKSYGSLIVCRLLAGVAGGPVLAVGAGTNADLFATHYRAIAACCFVMMPFLGPSVRSQCVGPEAHLLEAMLTVTIYSVGSDYRWIRCSVQRLEMDTMVYHLHLDHLIPSGSYLVGHTGAMSLFFWDFDLTSAQVLPTKETYKKTILSRRAKALNLPGPPQTRARGFAYVKFIFAVVLGRPIHMLCVEPIVLFLSMVSGVD